MFLVLAATPVQALETDQFTLPPQPLEDIGGEVDAIYSKVVVQAIEEANKKIGDALRSKKKDKIKEAQEKMMKPEFLTKLVSEHLAPGLPKSKIEKLIEKISIPKEKAFFKPKNKHSIFNGVFAPFPFAFRRAQYTALIHGHYAGLDKLGHAFQQGWTYYKNVHEALGKGVSYSSALAKEVRDGHETESSYYGTMISGVFSNGDLAANYAGYKLYENLTTDVTIAGTTYPSLVELDGQTWKLKVAPSEITVRQFVSDHWNEARNPSIYTFNRGKIRKAVQARCARWFELFPNMTLESERENRVRMSTWFGEDYGWNDPEDKEVSLATECFRTAPAPESEDDKDDDNKDEKEK